MKILKAIPVAAYLLFARLLKRFWHFPAPAFTARYLDSDRRRRRQPPEQIIERSGIKAGMTVLDLGCGSGAFTPFVARAVGGKGKVYAVDIQTAVLRQLEDKLARPENRDITNW